MSSQGYTQVKSSQDNDGAVSKGTASRNSTSKASISSGKMGKKAGINLTSVESLLFFNMVCFNRDPGNIDWDLVAKHSNLKNAGSARVRFRQIQRKYGLDLIPSGRQIKRKTRAPAAADEHDDDTENADEDNDGHANAPPKKRFKKYGAHERAAREHVCQEQAIAQEDIDSEAAAIVFTVSNTPIADHLATAQEVQNMQRPQIHRASVTKQESPLSQAQLNAASPTRPVISSGHQQRSLPKQPSQAYDTAAPYSMFPTQDSGMGMMPGMYPFQHTSGISSPLQSHVMTQQQMIHLQNVRQQLYQERAYNAKWGGYPSPYGQSNPQVQSQSYLMRPGGSQYDEPGYLPSLPHAPQDYFSAQGQIGNQVLSQTPAQYHAATQSPAISLDDDNSAFSTGDDFYTSVAVSPTRSLFEEMVQMPNPASDPATTATYPADQGEFNQGETGKSASKYGVEVNSGKEII